MSRELRRVEPLDWRYAAAITGLARYLTWLGDRAPDWSMGNDYLEYDPASINEEDYLKFVEDTFPREMHHRIVEEMLRGGADSEAQIKVVNDKLSANTVMKKIFKSVKYDGGNADEILRLIDENREELIRETYRNKNNLYKNYCNPNLLFVAKHDCCRLWGYYVDLPKKGKSLTYRFDLATLISADEQIFDFIPFAFSGEREFFFINDNVLAENLFRTNSLLAFKIEEEKRELEKQKKETESGRGSINSRRILFKLLIESKDFIRGDIEVVFKDVNKSHFETMYLRKQSLDILNRLGEVRKEKYAYESLCFPIKMGNDWIPVFETVVDGILNLTLLDELIDCLLKQDQQGSRAYAIDQLIKINIMIKGEIELEQATKGAYACAEKVVRKKAGENYKVPDNKLRAYRQKLTSALAFEDYERFNQILLNLANYADETFDFAYDLFEDFDKNKELANTFVNALYRSNNREKGE